jgi:hypothetical protein
VQAVLKDAMPEEQQREWAERAVRVVNAAFPDGGWHPADHVLTYALVCASLIEQYQIASSEASRLLDLAADRQPEVLFQRALAIYDIVHGHDHPGIATIVENCEGSSPVLRQARNLTAKLTAPLLNSRRHCTTLRGTKSA